MIMYNISLFLPQVIGNATAVELGLVIGAVGGVFGIGVAVGVSRSVLKQLGARLAAQDEISRKQNEVLQQLLSDIRDIKVELVGFDGSSGFRREQIRHRDLLHWLASCVLIIATKQEVELPPRAENK